jgi:transcriptional regulator with XRE-family HTH domain
MAATDHRGKHAVNNAEWRDHMTRPTFGEALRLVLADRAMSQQELAESLGLSSQSVVSQWISGVHEPSPSRVFAIERELAVPPGHLSRLLGYLPITAVPAVDVSAALQADTALTDQQRRAVLAVYDTLRGPAQAPKRRRR